MTLSSLLIEHWCPVEGFPDYKVSNFGRVKSLKFGRERLLKLRVGTPDPYSRVSLLHDGKTTEFKVHRLVASHFIPNPEEKPEVNHKDGVKSNCRVDNLEWATRIENDDHSRIVLGKGYLKTPITVVTPTGKLLYFASQMDAVRSLGVRGPDLHRTLQKSGRKVGGYLAYYTKEDHHEKSVGRR